MLEHAQINTINIKLYHPTVPNDNNNVSAQECGNTLSFSQLLHDSCHNNSLCSERIENILLFLEEYLTYCDEVMEYVQNYKALSDSRLTEQGLLAFRGIEIAIEHIVARIEEAKITA